MVGILPKEGIAPLQPLTREEIAARVIRVIGEHLDNPPETIAETDDLRDTLGADSLDLVEMVMSLEVEFGSIEIADRDWENVTTVASAIDVIVTTLTAAGRDIAAGRA